MKRYLHMLEEAEKRDHRKLGRQLDLFHVQEEAPGMVFWHPHGWIIWQEVEQYMRGIYRDYGYQEVRCPQILDISLWEKSGHWEHYKDNMFTTSSENRDYAVKPMNCPGHVQIFNTGIRSYRDLPLRYGEFGSCHRNEPSGALHGVMRVRGFTQDDGHIFCTEDQIQSEVIDFNVLVQKVYQDFGFTDVAVKIALRPDSRVGSDEVWDKAEDALRSGLRASVWNGPNCRARAPFTARRSSSMSRMPSAARGSAAPCRSIFRCPGGLARSMWATDDTPQAPVMLHRAILGSLERFIGILVENHSGAFPLWLAPVQVVVMNISEAQTDYAEQVAKMLREAGLRVERFARRENKL